MTNLGGQLVWVILVECLDYIGCIHQVFRGFPTHCIWDIVKPFPFSEIKEPWPLAMTIKSTVEDLMNLPLVRVIQLDQWWWVYGSVGNLTGASGLQQ